MKIGLIFNQKSAEQLPKDLSPYGLVDYADNNFAKDPKDRNSFMGYCFVLNEAVISWNSEKQRTFSTSITKAKYIAFGHAARKTISIRRLINKIGLEAIKNFTLYGNNKMSITLTKNAESQN